MFEAYVDGKHRRVEIMGAYKNILCVAFMKSLKGQPTRHVQTVPYSRISWKSDDWYEVSRKIIA